MKKLLGYSSALMALAGVGGAAYAYTQMPEHDPTPGDSFVAPDGTKWNKMGDDALSKLFLQDDGVQMTSVEGMIPYQFWTAAQGRGMGRGMGVAPGKEFITLKSVFTDLYVYHKPDTTAMGAYWDSTVPQTKYRPQFIGDGKIGLQAWNGKWVQCTNDNWMYACGAGPGLWEQWYVYTTSSENDGLAGGDDFIALKSAKNNKFAVLWSDSWLACHTDFPTRREKFKGWAGKAAWSPGAVEFNTAAAQVEEMTPETLGRLTTDNRGGTTTRSLQTTITKSVGESSSFSQTDGVSLTVGTTFSASVPKIGVDASLSTSATTSSSQTMGQSKSTSKSFSTTITCDAPPNTKVVCTFVAKKGKMTIPYTMHLSKPGGWNEVIHGVYSGIQAFDSAIQFEETHY